MGAATEFVKSAYEQMIMCIQAVNFCRYERAEYARQAAVGGLPNGRRTYRSTAKS